MTSFDPHTAGRAESPRGIVTNGVGQATTAHLNLTRTFAQVIAGNRDFLRVTSFSRKARK